MIKVQGLILEVNQVCVTDDFRKRLDDLVWKIRCHGIERWLYIYLILVPQSTVDEDVMALRNDLSLEAVLSGFAPDREGSGWSKISSGGFPFTFFFSDFFICSAKITHGLG